MKRLGNTLYVLTSDAYLSLEGETIVIQQEGKRLGQLPLHNLESIVYFGRKGVSPFLLGACAQRGIGLSFYSGHGRFLARVARENKGNVLLRQRQYEIAANEESAKHFAANFIAGKIFNARWVLERARRDHPLQIDMGAVDSKSAELKTYIGKARAASSLAELRGIEGSAARAYFSVFKELILQNKDGFRFDGRNRRPPKDPLNAMLSFCYSMLANDCSSALEGVGLDPYCGFLHAIRPGRKSMALDLMEELRAPFADRVVVTCVNNKVVTPEMFDARYDGSVYLSEKGRKALLSSWQSRKQEEIKHPFLKEKVSWGLLPHVQALLLARCLRGDLDSYPVFLWK